MALRLLLRTTVPITIHERTQTNAKAFQWCTHTFVRNSGYGYHALEDQLSLMSTSVLDLLRICLTIHRVMGRIATRILDRTDR